MLDQILIYLEKYKIIPNSHKGGRKNYSTIDVIEEVHDKFKKI